jgi:hypothetical protein
MPMMAHKSVSTIAVAHFDDMFVRGFLPVCDPLGKQLKDVPTSSGVGFAAGTSTAVGKSPIIAVGLSSCTGVATGVGRSTTPGVGFGDARGVNTANAVGRSTASSKGTAASVGSVNAAGSATVISYTDIYHPAIATWGYGNERGSHRSRFALTGNSAGKLRLTLEVVCNVSGNLAYDDALHVSFGKWAGTNYDTTAAPIEVTFSGASGFTGPRAGAQYQTIVSDVITHAGLTLSAGDILVVAIDQNFTDATRTGHAYIQDGSLTTEFCGWFVNADTYNNATPGSAGSSQQFTNRGIAKVETQTTTTVTFAIGVGLASAAGHAFATTGTATLIWSDEFDSYPSVVSNASGGTSDVTSNWRYDAIWQNADLGYRDFAGTSWNINPNDPHYAGYNPFSVAGSVLTIQAFRTPPALTAQIRADLDAQGNTGLAVPAWCGGFLQTNSKKRKFVYAYVEWKARWANPGKGMFPALWMYSSDLGNDPQGKSSAEVDVLEMFGQPNLVNTTIIMKGTSYDPGNAYAVPGSPFSEDTSGWHTYGYDRQPGFLKFYYDGVLMATITGSDAAWFNGVNMDVMINFAMDAPWFGSGNMSDGTTPSPMNMDIDYVRVYTTKP